MLEDISKELIDSGVTYTVTSGRILFITNLHGPAAGAVGASFQVNGVAVAHTTTAKSDTVWKLRNPILADAGWVIDGSAGGAVDWDFQGFEIVRTGGIIPIVLAARIQGSVDYVVPADKIFVLLGVSCLDAINFGIEDDGSGNYPSLFTDVSMVWDSGAGGDDASIAENRIQTPMILPAGAKMGGTSIGCTIWGYEVDV